MVGGSYGLPGRSLVAVALVGAGHATADRWSDIFDCRAKLPRRREGDGTGPGLCGWGHLSFAPPAATLAPSLSSFTSAFGARRPPAHRQRHLRAPLSPTRALSVCAPTSRCCVERSQDFREALKGLSERFDTQIAVHPRHLTIALTRPTTRSSHIPIAVAAAVPSPALKTGDSHDID